MKNGCRETIPKGDPLKKNWQPELRGGKQPPPPPPPRY